MTGGIGGHPEPGEVEGRHVDPVQLGEGVDEIVEDRRPPGLVETGEVVAPDGPVDEQDRAVVGDGLQRRDAHASPGERPVGGGLASQ